MMMGWLRKEKSMPDCPGFVDSSAALSQPKLIGRAPLVHRLVKHNSASSSQLHIRNFKAGTSESEKSRSHSDQRGSNNNRSSSNLCSEARHPSSASVSGYTALEQHERPRESVQAAFRPRASFANAGTIPAGMAKPRASIATISTIAMAVEPDIWPRGSYTISLIIDNREVKSKVDRAGFYNACVKSAHAMNKQETERFNVEQRALALGDALWIAVHKITKKEVVLDSIVERKRLDDLCSSIKDTRFHEQKVRSSHSISIGVLTD